METLLEVRNDLTSGEAHSTLRYELLAQPMAERIGYGVAVTNERTGERAVVADALTRRADAEALLRRISEGTVTPVTLWDVVEDFVAEI